MSTVISEPGASSNLYLDRVKLVLGDITQQDADAIVTLIPKTLECYGSINGAICRAAGRDMQAFVRAHISAPVVGEVYALPGFDMPCKHILFCIVPPWRSEFERRSKYLVRACRDAVKTASAMGLKSLAFPPLLAGRRGFKTARAARLILKGIGENLDGSLAEVRIVSQSPEILKTFQGCLAARGHVV